MHPTPLPSSCTYTPYTRVLAGTYTLKAEAWDSAFDPLLLLNRTFVRREYQAALANYQAHVTGAQHSGCVGPRRCCILHCMLVPRNGVTLARTLHRGGSIRPPFRPMGALPAPYTRLAGLLHCPLTHWVGFCSILTVFSSYGVASHVCTACRCAWPWCCGNAVPSRMPTRCSSWPCTSSPWPPTIRARLVCLMPGRFCLCMPLTIVPLVV